MNTYTGLVVVVLGLATSLSAPARIIETKNAKDIVVSESRQISLVMKQQFDRPDALLTVEPVTVLDNYALAGWIQGKKGGRALLQKVHGKWKISVCFGDGLTQAKVLETTGMGWPMAQQLAAAAAAAESKLSAEQRRLFDSFEGMVKVDAHHGSHSSTTK